METNNQNFPPVPAPSSDSQNIIPPAPPKPPISPKLPLSSPPIPPMPPEKIEEVNFIDPSVANNNNRKIVILSIVLVLAILAIYGIFAARTLRKDAKNVKVSGDQVSMAWKGMNIAAQLAPKETVSFMTNGGQMDSRNTGLFGVIPMNKVKYLEQKYTDFIHCGSPGESEAKSLEYSLGIFTNTVTAEAEMSKINGLVKKGNLVIFEVDGSQLQQMQQIQAGKSNPIMSSQLVFYLVDYVRIVEEKYQ